MSERWNCDLLDVPAWHPVAVAAELLERIVADADVCFGRPTIRGHRVWVSTVLGYLAEGWSTEAVLVEFRALKATMCGRVSRTRPNWAPLGSPTSTSADRVDQSSGASSNASQ